MTIEKLGARVKFQQQNVLGEFHTLIEVMELKKSTTVQLQHIICNQPIYIKQNKKVSNEIGAEE